jgi:Histidinol-phosphate/aromatic aminotransferase and cobyric acid decarboxylase
LDEAYIEFSELKTMTAKINTYENLIILRTLSKAYALAGVRCGAIIANSEISEFIKKILPPFCFATPTIELIKNSITPENIDNAKAQINLIKKEKERVNKELNKSAIVNKVFQSEGNFLLVKFNDINKLKSILENTNIIIGFLKYPSLSKFARITIGTREENDILLNLLMKIQ